MITDKTSIENYMLTTIDSTFDTQLTEWIEGVQNEIDRMTDRQIIADDEDTDNKYDGNNKYALVVDDFVSVTTVTVNEVDMTEYCYYYPANKTPYWRIESDYTFTKGRQNILVTGTRGYCTESTLPSDLKWAATVLVAGIINYSNNSTSEIKSETIGRYTVTYQSSAQEIDFKRALRIISSYRRLR